MSGNILKLVDNKLVNKSTENDKPIFYHTEEIPFITCIEIPSGFKFRDFMNITIKYNIDKQFLNTVEFNDELEVEISNNITKLPVKTVKLIGTLGCCTSVKGFCEQEKGVYTANDNISFLNSNRININNNICSFFLQSNIDYDNLKNLYKIEIRTIDIFIFTEDGNNRALLNFKENITHESSDELLLNNLYRKYIIIKSKIMICKSEK